MTDDALHCRGALLTPITGWFDPAPKGGSLRLAANSYLPARADPAVRLPGLRRGDLVTLENGRVTRVNGAPPEGLAERPEFAKLGAVHPSRPVLLGKGAVIVLDSRTRLARSHNTTGRASGRTMSGGLDANALAKPKALFGAARAVPTGGSLSVIATALVETESRMDDVIFEEFKGTGNAELRLVRALADRRIYPAVDIAASGTRREELLAEPATVAAKQNLRRGLVGLPPEKGMEVLLTQLRRARTNAELLKATP